MIFSKKLLFGFVFLFGFYTCTLFKKNISKPVIVAMPDKSTTVTVNTTAFNAKYSINLSNDEVLKQFLKGFESEAKITNNVTFNNEEEGADFVIKIKSITITESSKVEKINDAKSPYNGQEMVLNTIDCSAEIEIIDIKNKTKKLSNCYNTKSRSEKLKNNRDLGDLISGSNKDHTTYRSKLLSDDICTQLSGDVGRRIWVPITKRIAKSLK